MKRSGILAPVAFRASVLVASTLTFLLPHPATAATIAPPMLDISHQCDVATRHNVTAMSECIVAESEARADLLQHWDKLPDGDVEKCVKLARKAKRQPYTAMETCLAADISQTGKK